MDVKEKAGDFLLDIAKLVFGGVILAGIIAEDINRMLLYSMGAIAVASCIVTAFIIYKNISKRKED